MAGFPRFRATNIINEFEGNISNINKISLIHKQVKISFPTRLNIMVLDQTKIAPNEDMIFPAGEVLISVKKFINVTIKYLNNDRGELVIKDSVRRKVLAHRAYHLITHVLRQTPSLIIDIDDSEVIKHSGLGTTGATLGAVCVAINEMYGNPISRLDLARYLAANYGEEIDDENQEELQCMPSFGGSFLGGLFDGSVLIIAGHAVPIMSGEYCGSVVIGIPEDYVPGTAASEVERHGQYLFENPMVAEDAPVVSKSYNANIAYHMLNEAMPLLRLGDISGISKLSFDMNFNVEAHGVSDFDWFFPRANEIANNIRYLYDEGHCDGLGKSSTGPAFFALVRNQVQYDEVEKSFKAQNMKVISTEVCSETYEVEF